MAIKSEMIQNENRNRNDELSMEENLDKKY